jgi:NAD(P)-dependent dehydrogenase (short-subunit alcohol dehydrogenase family)
MFPVATAGRAVELGAVRMDQREVAVVTGAGAGAARAIALRFAREGWRVALISRSRERLQDAAEEVGRAGGEPLVLPLDVSDAAVVAAAKDQVLERWGVIDAWINAAMATVVAPVSEMTPDEYRRVTEVTYLGCVNGTLAALEAMRPRDRGAIVQVGSALAYRAIPLQSAYCASKFAIRGFSDALRSELLRQRSRITVTMLQMPGMNTPQFGWARDKLPVKYQPVGEVFDPQVAGEAAWRAVVRRPRELWVGGSAVKAILGQMIAPALMDRYIGRTAWDGQLTQTPNPHGPDNLEAPAPGRQGVRGRFGDRAKPRALLLDPERARLGVCALAAVIAGLLTVARVSGRRERAG